MEYFEKLFFKFLNAGTEGEVHDILESEGLLNNQDNWHLYGEIESNFGIVENQQAHPVPALVEKITNGIDAILERKCLEEAINPTSDKAPRSMKEALERYFPKYKYWDNNIELKKQAEELQIVADGPKGETSLLIYDNGVGQSPETFPDTFLSLVRGKKKNIQFVQGKYNMGGTGAIAFCGKKRYQLIASKRYDGLSKLGYTLIRQHPLSKEEERFTKATWYEFLEFKGKVPSFECGKIDAGLENRQFQTGSLVKLYSYRLPPGIKSEITRDLKLSLNGYLFQPALPFYTVEKIERYPHNKGLTTSVYGLKNQLDSESNEYVERKISKQLTLAGFGKLSVTAYVFKLRTKNKNVEKTREYIQREYFKNKMSVLFSLNGQVQGDFKKSLSHKS